MLSQDKLCKIMILAILWGDQIIRADLENELPKEVLPSERQALKDVRDVKDVKDVEKKQDERQEGLKKESKGQERDKKLSGGKAKEKAMPEPTKQKADQYQPIFFAGDTLIGLRKKGVLEIKENVDVKQGSFKLTAARAKIFFDANDEIEKVVASGNVHIRKVDEQSKEEIDAQGENVEFLAVDQIIILQGDASLKRASDTVKGSLIRYYMLSGKIEAEKVKGVVKAQEEFK